MAGSPQKDRLESWQTKNCTIVFGYLEISDISLDNFSFPVLPTIQEILGYLVLSNVRSSRELSLQDILPELAVVHGRHTYNITDSRRQVSSRSEDSLNFASDKAVVVIEGTSLSSLALPNRLCLVGTEFESRSVVLSRNDYLCINEQWQGISLYRHDEGMCCKSTSAAPEIISFRSGDKNEFVNRSWPGLGRTMMHQ